MAKTVKINGVTYNDVNEIKVPLASDPATLAIFPDTDDATATEADTAKGKTFYANGTKHTGTKTDPIISVTDGILSIS